MGRNTKHYSSTQERRLAASVGGQVQPASGALNIGSLKSDVKNVKSIDWKILISAKTTMCESHQDGVRSKSIKKDWLNEVSQQAREGGYDFGVLAFSFDNRVDYYAIKDTDFNNMYQALLDYEKLVIDHRQEINRLSSLIDSGLKSEGLRYFNIESEEE